MDKIDALLREKFEDFGEDDSYLGFFEDEPQTLDYTEYLLGLHEEDIETEVWNNFSYDIEKDFPKVKAIIDSTNCYPLVKAFIKKREEKYYHNESVNTPIKTARLLLKPMPDEDAKFLFESIQKDYAAIPTFWNYLPEKNDMSFLFKRAFIGRQRHFFFPAFYGIYVADIKTPIGYLGLTEFSTNPQGKSIFNLEYYILPKYRGNGYITEACRAAIDSLRAGTINKALEKERSDIFNPEPFDPILILGKCHLENESSKHILEKLWFVYEGICYENYFGYDEKPLQMHCYHLLFE